MDDAPSNDVSQVGLGGRLLGLSGSVAGITLLLLLAAQFAVVAVRAMFGETSPWLQESVVYFHAVVIALAVGWTLLRNRHVRIDALHGLMGARFRSIIERAGLIAIIAACAVIAVLSWGFVSSSWLVFEGSREIGGLPGVFLLKTLVPVTVLLLAFAAFQRLRGTG